MNESRRNFLKTIAIAGAGTMLLPKILQANDTDFTISENIFDKEFVILFQGDSITDGNRGRNSDPNHIMGHGYAFSIASRLGADYPEKNLKFINKGISANRVTDLAARWQKDTLDLNPDLLSILIGVNDTHVMIDKKTTETIQQFEEVYKSLLDQVKSIKPEIIFVLNQPFILPVGKVKDNWDAWHNQIIECQKVVEKIATEYKAVYVKHQDVFDAACKKAPADYWIWDGIHPTVAGHELMTREWIKQVKKKLKFIK